MGFWDGKKVLVTGGAGFIGSHVVEELLRRGRRVRVTIADDLSNGRRENLRSVLKDARLARADLRRFESCLKVCRGQEVILNLAARVAGVGYNSEHHGTMFRDNMAINSNMIGAAQRCGAERLLVVSSACVYPRDCAAPTPESEGFRDRPEPTNEGYGWAKRMAEFLAGAYRREFGLRVAIARPYNAYGPRDHFDSPHSHVIPALIRRAADGENPVTVWGDGTQSRSFLYAEDMARGLLDVTERYAECDPVNLGTDEEVTIRTLARLIIQLTGSKARLKFDASKPGGQPRRNCDTAKAKAVAGFSARIPLEEGLRRSLAWYFDRGRRGGA